MTENQLQGNPRSEWDLSGPASTSIEGFATSLSVNRGTTVSFKINTASANYRIDIYRLGWYGGLGARKVATIQRSTPSIQPAPGGNATIGLYDAGNWSVTTSWAVPATAVSGVYIAKLVRQDGTAGASHIPFVVRDDGAQRDIVFQTSDTTWHAYNGWGGANLYGGNATASVDGRAFKVSYNRPIGTRDAIGTWSGPQDFLFSAEYAAIRWLERNGYDVAYVTGVDTGPGNAQLTNYNVYMSTGHDEYWSRDQREHVEAARDAGVHLIFISGNEVYWKTRWEPDINGTPNRTLVCYKESRQEEKLDPTPAWTGTWRDLMFSPPADGNRPENSLTGTIFQVDSHREDIIRVPYEMTQLRFWRNSPIATNTQPGQTASLAVGMLGYEWDECPDNGFRPERLIHLSATTEVVGTYLLDYGHTVGDQTAVHNLALYKAASGAWVFGAGTVFWSFGLDTEHDYSNSSLPPTLTPEDLNVQQAMVNLFADMGVQPGTLRAGLAPATASTDSTPPVSTITAPTNGASVGQLTLVTVSGTASDTGGRVAGVEVSTDNGATWHPATGTTSWTYAWRPRLPGTYQVKTRAIDDSLNVETPGAGVSVTVTPAAAVSLFALTEKPFAVRSGDPNPVELGVRFSANTPGAVAGIRFYKTDDSTGPHAAHLWSAAGNLLASANFSGETAKGWQTVMFPAPVTITPGTTYVASYHTAYYAASPNYFRTPRSTGALTAPAGDNGVYAYGASGTFPNASFGSTNYWVDVIFNRAGGAGNLPPTAGNDAVMGTFNTPLVIPAATLLANDADPNGYPLSITSVGNPTNGTVSLDAGAQTVTFTPTTGFSGLATFTYQVGNAVGGSAQATVSVTVNSLTTVQTLFQPSNTPNTITVADPTPVALGVKFRSAVSGTRVTGVRFYKGPQNVGTHTAHLWNATGGPALATATFSGETASGWQSVNFPAPVTINPNTTYVVSYHSNGFYSASSNFFATTHTRGALTAPAAINGVFTYGPAGTFPTSTFNNTNYWVDVITEVPTGLVAQSLFGAGDTPALVSMNDPNAVEVGVRFTCSTGGQATGMKFYKGAQNTGTHVGRLWQANGTQLATATFIGETASGWQSVNFPAPVTLTAGTTYIVSYHAPVGRYSASSNFFTAAHISGALTAPAGTNGVFTYGPAGSFPSSSFNSTNYWVDVIVQATTP
ncbi:MAG TPA: DUF4082 domain-containing protein [Actinophytocola sp.]|uniref:DUF4082 domain-containing protein n=1 Tax=Actinophytocola sp. TaxID=1872138 RepID=UPI002DB774D6|nr:DUF4082 domain-containing protein [Actinophytocola sp.]HEU5472686.1 DUF4082 domain-containing protein [Actinophytocola sp.]